MNLSLSHNFIQTLNSRKTCIPEREIVIPFNGRGLIPDTIVTSIEVSCHT